MPIRIQVDAQAAIRGLQNLERKIPNAISAALDESARIVIQGAQSTVPVDTGALRDSIDVKDKGPNYIVIAADTEYAAVIEFGNSTHSAQPYMGPQADKLPSEASRALSNALSRTV